MVSDLISLPVVSAVPAVQVNYWPSNVEHTDEIPAKRYPPVTKAVQHGQKVRTDLPKAKEDPLYDFRQAGAQLGLSSSASMPFSKLFISSCLCSDTRHAVVHPLVACSIHEVSMGLP